MRIILIALVVICGLNVILARSLNWNTLEFDNTSSDEKMAHNWSDNDDDDLFDITQIQDDDDAVYKKFVENLLGDVDDDEDSDKVTEKVIFTNDSDDNEDINDNSYDEMNDKAIKELVNLITILSIDDKFKTIDDQVNDNSLINDDNSLATGNANVLISLIIGIPTSSEVTNEPKDINEVLDELFKDLPDNETKDDSDEINDGGVNIEQDNDKTTVYDKNSNDNDGDNKNEENDTNDANDNDDGEITEKDIKEFVSLITSLNSDGEFKSIADQVNDNSLINDDNSLTTGDANILISLIIGVPNSSEETNEHKDINEVLDELFKDLPDNETKDDADEINDGGDNFEQDNDKTNVYDKNNNDNDGDNRNEDNDANDNDSDDSSDTDKDQFSIVLTGDNKKSLDDHKYDIIIPTITSDSYNSNNNKNKYNTDDPNHEYEFVNFKSLDDDKNDESTSGGIYE